MCRSLPRISIKFFNIKKIIFMFLKPGKPGQTEDLVAFTAPQGLSAFAAHREAEFTYSVNMHLGGEPKVEKFY
jgi:hypothetical protein